jgi:hypothetical protein
MKLDYTGHTEKNGAVLIVFTINTVPFFCVCPVCDTKHNSRQQWMQSKCRLQAP